jgi:hypothetical protein
VTILKSLSGLYQIKIKSDNLDLSKVKIIVLST